MGCIFAFLSKSNQSADLVPKNLTQLRDKQIKKSVSEKNDAAFLLCFLQEKEAMEAAVRAFDDWEFRVLERESGIDEEGESTADIQKEGESEGDVEKEITCQQHAVNSAQVNNAAQRKFFRKFHSCSLTRYTGLQLISLSCGPCLPSPDW